MATVGSSPAPGRHFRFGPFEVAECDGELRKNGVRIKLQEQPFRVLVELVANSGKVVTREELQQRLWPADTFVDFDTGLNTAIRKLRQALNDDADEPRYIETLARRGYRFVAPVNTTSLSTRANGEGSGETVPDAALLEEQRKAPAQAETAAISTALPHWHKWYWILVASMALAVLVAGVMIARRGISSAPSLANEQRITSNPPEAPVTSSVISPDGKYIAYSDPTGVYIRHIASGETRPLQLPTHSNTAPTSWFPTGWFPDSAHLLLLAEEVGNDIPSVWTVSILGGNPQILIENAISAAVSPDGSAIAFLRMGPDNLELWVSRNNGSNARRIVDSVEPAIVARLG